ncbi:exported hypothetical protein [Desulfamplus magnetovallimortis]|uniref:LamG-like jellyroll fold domain-containing protein n=1 Tax=Desulfamplus magnetovallimortis TaxID=1246637 RepID=A0A1W1H666_9BACT|nr:LamG-like jellyroll fold domain-containing protein [Desulfamplus magnetovallimortis]SLM27926.1 exported hypothetical protein [Desulfamplus magnetovallimortis]
MIKKILYLSIVLFGIVNTAYAENYALNFDGTDDYVEIPYPNLVTNTFTVEFWMMYDGAQSNWNGIVDADWYFFTNINSPMAIFGAPDGSEIYFDIEYNQWHHIAGLYDGTSFKIYKDGVLQNSLTKVYTKTDSIIHIGRRTGETSNYFNGKIDDFRIWNIARSEEEIKANMYKEIDTDSNLLASYKMSDGSGASLTDDSSNGNTGTIYGGATWEIHNTTYDVIISSANNNGVWSGVNPRVWTPIGTGATVNISDIVTEFNAGKSVIINTGKGGQPEQGTLTVSNDIQHTSDYEVTLTLVADYRINVDASISSTTNKLHFYALAGKATIPLNNERIGQFRLYSTRSITTNGGNVTIEGVNNSCGTYSNPVNSKTYGCSGDTCRGIQLDGAIDAGGGNISLTGLRQGYTSAWSRGVQINNSVFTNNTGTITTNGEGDGNSDGVFIESTGSIESVNGEITITCDAESSGTGSGINTASGSIVNSTGSGNVSLISTSGAISGSNLTLISGGTTTLSAPSNKAITLDNTNNDFTGAVSVSSGDIVTLVDKNSLTIGSVNVNGAIDIASGMVSAGDLTLTGAITSQDTSTSSIKLNGGKADSAGTSTGGNIIVTGGTVTPGLGGSAILYTGSVSGSTGITGLPNYNISLVHYNSDETTSLTFGAGLYVVYREIESSTHSVSTYAELADAVTNSSSGDTISITADITVTSTISCTKDLTFDGNDNTLSVPTPGLTDSGDVNDSPSTFGVFSISGAGVNAVIKNMTIKGGHASGGGINVGTGATLRVESCLINNGSGNVKGGAINNSGTTYVYDCGIMRNIAQYGGGFVNNNGATMFIENCFISQNRAFSATGGGGAGENQGTLYINNSTIYNNNGKEIGGGINNYQGTLWVINSTFAGNVAYGDYNGGAIGVNGGSATVINSLFAYNYRKSAGSVDNPSGFSLDDVTKYNSNGTINSYYNVFHGVITGHDVNSHNITYGGSADGSDNYLFSGGIYDFIINNDNIQIGTAKVFQPFFPEVSSVSNRANSAVTLQTGSALLSSNYSSNGYTNENFEGTDTGYDSSNSASVIIGYYDKDAGTPAWVDLSGTGASSHVVTTDQFGDDRTIFNVRGAVSKVVDNVYMLKVNADANGSVSGGSPFGELYASGTNIILTATPDAGYEFVRWEDDLGTPLSTDNPYTLTVNSTETVVPIFDLPAEYIVTGTARYWSGGGTVSPATTTVSDGNTTTLTITPSASSSISTITGCNGTTVTGPLTTATTYTTGNITEDCTVTATFTLNSYTVTGTADTGGTISPGSRSVNYNDTTTFTIIPDWGYQFNNFTGGCPAGTWSGNTYTTGSITGDCTLNATFTPQTYTVTALATANGTISPAGNQNISHGDVATFTVTPDSGYMINYVLGCNGTRDGNSYTTGAITGPCKVMAFFKSQ